MDLSSKIWRGLHDVTNIEVSQHARLASLPYQFEADHHNHSGLIKCYKLKRRYGPVKLAAVFSKEKVVPLLEP
ncbi:hypothetical protein HAX54_052067 [Datura stramonium]|uniref:Uncharacterized protein n=1 Tax=Datura stramonium TaxID=4076 RepID=A0ABS8SYH0_DATST|nr:hypothetical protein [Datura stramonium]